MKSGWSDWRRRQRRHWCYRCHGGDCNDGKGGEMCELLSWSTRAHAREIGRSTRRAVVITAAVLMMVMGFLSVGNATPVTLKQEDVPNVVLPKKRPLDFVARSQTRFIALLHISDAGSGDRGPRMREPRRAVAEDDTNTLWGVVLSTPGVDGDEKGSANGNRAVDWGKEAGKQQPQGGSGTGGDGEEGDATPAPEPSPNSSNPNATSGGGGGPASPSPSSNGNSNPNGVGGSGNAGGGSNNGNSGSASANAGDGGVDRGKDKDSGGGGSALSTGAIAGIAGGGGALLLLLVLVGGVAFIRWRRGAWGDDDDDSDNDNDYNDIEDAGERRRKKVKKGEYVDFAEVEKEAIDAGRNEGYMGGDGEGDGNGDGDGDEQVMKSADDEGVGQRDTSAPLGPSAHQLVPLSQKMGGIDGDRYVEQPTAPIPSRFGSIDSRVSTSSDDTIVAPPLVVGGKTDNENKQPMYSGSKAAPWFVDPSISLGA